MDSMQDQMDDSRTSAVGRKRNLEEIEDQDLPHHSSPETDTQRSSKRVKEDEDGSEDSMVKDSIILNTLSHLPSFPTESSQTPPTTSQIPPTVAAPLRAGAWNRGVQSGLRTSFGSRTQPKSKLKSIIPSQNVAEPTLNAIAVIAGLSQKNTPVPADQDEEASPNIAETTEEFEVPTSASLGRAEGADVVMAEAGVQETATTSEEEGEISSSRNTEEDMDVLHDQTSDPLGQYAGRETSFVEDSLHQQAPRPLERDDGQPAGNVFGVDLQQRKTTDRPSSSNSVDEDMEDRSDVDAAEVAGSLVSQAGNPPFKVLGQEEVAQLTNIEKTKYMKMDGDKPREQKKKKSRPELIESFNRLTAEAESFFAYEGLPLPSKYSAVENNIASGQTFFSRAVHDDGRIYQKKGIDYNFPEISNDGKPIRIQDLTIDIFALAFLKENPEKWNHISLKVLRPAFYNYRNTFYSHHAAMLGWSKEKEQNNRGDSATIETAQREATAALQDDEGELLPDDEIEIDIDQADIGSIELKLQEKYFPSANDRPASYHCLACGNSSHMTIECPSLACTMCGGDHVEFTCLQNRRCNKCRQRGHDFTDCPEKLALSKAEAIGCDFCGSTDHFEVQCHTIWRTFHPKPRDIQKVREIPVHCYICGGAGHYGPECGLYKDCPMLSGGQTWSTANLIKYIDANSGDRAMSAGIDYSIVSKPSKSTKQFNIKGKASNPIDLDDSDDDVTFLHEKVQAPKNHGQIKIAGTARLGQLPQQANYARAPNPPRATAPDFPRNSGQNLPPRVESARYGREPTFSPPPRYDDMRYGFSEAEDHFQPQAPHQRENSYWPRPSQPQNNYQATSQGTLPIRPSGNNSRGGHTGRGGRGGGNNQGGAARGGREKKKRRGGGGAGGRGARRGS